MHSLKTRLILTCLLFTGLLTITLIVASNQAINSLFTRLVKENIELQRENIVSSLAAEYSPEKGQFNLDSVKALGMSFVHQGYIVSIRDHAGNIVWDARECDMGQCVAVTGSIEKRMQAGHSLPGDFTAASYPLLRSGARVGEVTIETYSPFFYNEHESRFMMAISRTILIIGVAFILLSIIISIALTAAISGPILKIAGAAKEIAGGKLNVRIKELFKSKELNHLAEAVNDLAANWENGEEWQKRLTSDIAHELRTPLTCLQGNIEAMIDGVWQASAKNLQSCHEEIMRLTRLVENLNQLSTLERKYLVLHKTDFNLSNLLADIAGQYLPLAESKGLKLKLNASEAPVRADKDRLRQVFVNILTNAIAYTDRGQIDIALEKKGAEYLVHITDSGIGIQEEELPHIFRRFYRSDKSRNRNTGGAGIGLSIAQGVVNAHGGRIEVRSSYGCGSTFSVVLPVAGVENA